MYNSMNYDTAVIGASSSGLVAARRLAEEGERVAVFERATNPQENRRTYIVTPELLAYEPRLHSIALNNITEMELISPNSNASIKFVRPDIVIERNQLLAFLRERALAAGVEIFEGFEFSSISVRQQKTPITFYDTSRRQYKVFVRNLIGADGVNSSVAKAAGIRLPRQVPLLQAEIALSSIANPTISKVWFLPEQTPFFFWLIPESSERAVVGLISNNKSKIRAQLDSFLEANDFSPQGYQAGRAALFDPTLRPYKLLGNLRIMLIGDAAGQVKNTTVGGTITGFAGANAATEAILAQVPYRRSIQRAKRELITHWFIQQVLEKNSSRDYDRLIAQLNTRLVSFLERQNRDTFSGSFFQIAFIQPLLMLFVLKKLASFRIAVDTIVFLWQYLSLGIVKPTKKTVKPREGKELQPNSPEQI